jgi:hypothetical protein
VSAPAVAIFPAGESADASLGYDWAIVTSGSPKNANILNGKCLTGNALGTNQGEYMCRVHKHCNLLFRGSQPLHAAPVLAGTLNREQIRHRQVPQ